MAGPVLPVTGGSVHDVQRTVSGTGSTAAGNERACRDRPQSSTRFQQVADLLLRPLPGAHAGSAVELQRASDLLRLPRTRSRDAGRRLDVFGHRRLQGTL